MKRTKEIVTATVLAMVIGMAACNGANTQPAPTGEAKVETMTVNSFDIEISSVPYAKYQTEILKDCDYYIDGLDESDSPAFIFIAPAGKSVYREVADIQADDSQNVTITVRETTATVIGSDTNPITQVKIYPFPASVTVVDENGNTLSGN